MGFGDVKLAVALGCFMGYINLALVHIFITISFSLGAIVGLVMMALKKTSKGQEIPFGPYIALGSIATILYFY